MKIKSSIICCLLLLPMIGWGQSEVSRRVSASEMGYKGRVKMVQSTEFCTDSAHTFSVTTTEMYNEQGLRTDMSVEDDIYRTEYHYEYDDNGQLTYYLATYSCWEKDSIVFHYAPNGCLQGYDQYYLSADPTEGSSVTVYYVGCDARCRVLMCASVWEDTTWYEYDTQGRLLKKTQSWQPDKAQTYDYNRHGRLARVRSGDEHYEDTHYRYDANHDTIEVWHTNWEHWEGETGDHEIGKHKYYTYSAYDDHGNWTKAEVTVLRSHTYTVIRTFQYYK